MYKFVEDVGFYNVYIGIVGKHPYIVHRYTIYRGHFIHTALLPLQRKIDIFINVLIFYGYTYTKYATLPKQSCCKYQNMCIYFESYVCLYVYKAYKNVYMYCA